MNENKITAYVYIIKNKIKTIGIVHIHTLLKIILFNKCKKKYYYNFLIFNCNDYSIIFFKFYFNQNYQKD